MIPDKIRISLNELRPGIAQKLMHVISDSEVEVTRVFDPDRSLGGDDIIIEGNLKNLIDQIAPMVGSFKSIRFANLDGTLLSSKLENHGLSMSTGEQTMLFGTSLIEFAEMQNIIHFSDFSHYFRALQATQFGSEILPFLPVKARGLVFLDAESIEFILPIQSLPTLQAWITHIIALGSPDIETLLTTILQPTNPFAASAGRQSISWGQANAEHILSLANQADVADYLSLYAKSVSIV